MKDDKSPTAWMPTMTGEYLKETMHFTEAEEHGAYFLLCLSYWTNECNLPTDEKSLRKIAKLSAHKWKKISQIILKNFSISESKISHQRLDSEYADAIRKRQEATEKGRAGAKARWGDKGCSGNAQALHEQCPSSSPSPNEFNNSPLPPHDVDNSARGHNGQQSRVLKHFDVIELLSDREIDQAKEGIKFLDLDWHEMTRQFNQWIINDPTKKPTRNPMNALLGFAKGKVNQH
jgi:uncharacterized protein YdaU (DUF1376 family)